MSHILTNNYVNIFWGGKPFYAEKNHPNFSRIVDLVKIGQIKEALPLFDLAEIIRKTSFGNITVKPDGVFYKNTKINNYVADRILEFLKDGGDVEPLVNFLERLLQNPNKHIFNNLYSYLEKYKLPIDADGSFYAIKAVRNNLTSKWNPNVQYGIYDTYSEPRQLLLSPDENDSYCGPGLWFGWTQFVFNYGSGNDKVLLVRVNPEDVIATPNLEHYQKMAACAITPVRDLGLIDEAKKLFQFNSNVAAKIPEISSISDNKPKRDSRGRFVKS